MKPVLQWWRITRPSFWPVGLVAVAGAVQAHMVLETPQAAAGSYYKAVFKVGHGCGESATREVTVEIPAGVMGAKPMPKPGWSIKVERQRLDAPIQDHGRQVTEAVSRVTWTARTDQDALPNGWYDEFALQAKLPAQPGRLYWKTSQVCDQGRLDWHQVPAAGQADKALKSPAAVLELLPSGPGHQH